MQTIIVILWSEGCHILWEKLLKNNFMKKIELIHKELHEECFEILKSTIVEDKYLGFSSKEKSPSGKIKKLTDMQNIIKFAVIKNKRQ
jgi:hypothetical protein